MNNPTPVFIDFEVYWASDYSLSKMPTVLFVRDPRFYVQGVGIAVGDQPARWFTGEKIRSALETIEWETSMLVAHNALFDGTVLTEHYGLKPARYCDTAGLARTFLPVGIGADLDSAASAFGLGRKVEGTLASIKGIREPSPEQLDALGVYCKQDVELCRGLYDLLYPHMPETERYAMSMVVRMGVEPVLQLNQDILKEEIVTAHQHREDSINNSDQHLDLLSSNQQFADLLRSLTGDCPTQINKNGERVPCLSKSKASYVKFKAEHPELAPLFEAREAAKSTIMLRRPETLLQIAQTGTMPAPYRWSGAHTHRLSGTDGLNVQNLPNLHKSKLRLAFEPPPGYKLLISDLSQIELRMQLLFSGELEALAKLAFGSGGDTDLYTEFASDVYDRTITKKDKRERAVGKAGMLGAQYGLGPAGYQAYLAGGPLGMDPMFVDLAEATKTIYAFRARFPRTAAMWRQLDFMIGRMYQEHCDEPLGPIRFIHERIVLPNGLALDFTGLRPTDDGWVYGVGVEAKLYGARLLENIVQALARIVIMDQAVEIDRTTPAQMVMQTHDENIAIAPDEVSEPAFAQMTAIMRTPPHWAPDLPLDTEGGISSRYDK